MRYRPGPALLVTAAFIGPGTVTTATLAGSQYGFAIVWALAFATLATIILQNMAGTVAITRQQGLAEALLTAPSSFAARIAMALLLLASMAIGNAAYEAGNIGGAVLGLELIFAGSVGDQAFAITAIAGIAIIALLSPGRRFITGLLMLLVVFMSLAFIGAALTGGINWSAFGRGLIPTIPPGATLTIIALIGTTIVPYNLFLHAAMARQRWDSGSAEAVRSMRADTISSVTLGGLVSIAIMATAATHAFAAGLAVTGPADLALQLKPLTGPYAPVMLGMGLFAAGLTSAITAPLATGIIVAEMAAMLSLSAQIKTNIEKAVAIIIVGIGAIVAISGTSLISMIVTAQAANGLLLPIVAIMLYRLRYHKAAGDIATPEADMAANLLGQLAGLAIIVITLLLGARLIARSLGLWG